MYLRDEVKGLYQVSRQKIMSELADFEYQLQAESSYSEPASSTSQSTASTYVDPSDGTVYEWDQKQRGWVPKVSSKGCTPVPTH